MGKSATRNLISGRALLLMLRAFLIIIVVILVVPGCICIPPSPGSPSPESPLSNKTAGDSPLPTPLAARSDTPIPQPQVGFCTVTGTLVKTRNGSVSGPITNTLLFLAPIMYSDDGTFSMARLNKRTDPVFMTDEAGRFVFSDVEVKEYALIYSSGASEFSLKDPSTNEELIINAVSDQIIDLGEVYIEELP